MAAPVFVDAGAGVSNASGTTLTPARPATVNPADCLLLHCLNWVDTQTIATPTGWTLIDGPDDNTPMRGYLYGQIADGTEDGATVSVVWSASPSQHAARIYRFSGTDTSATFWESVSYASDSGTSVLDIGVTTLGVDRLALNVVGLGQATTIGSYTGESGGDWTEAVAEFSADSMTLQLQTATMAAQGTINGGSATAGLSARSLIYGLALKPYVPSGANIDVTGFPKPKVRPEFN